MMFNGLIMCGDSDNSDFTKESHRTSSVAESGATSGAGSGHCSAVTRALHYHEKLMATLQILENKDEMIRIQADSIRLAESRISELTSRAEDLREKLQEKSNELSLLQASIEYEKSNRTSVSASTDLPEHERVVRTLQSSLCVFEELYRECFYEAAKQEQLIDMLRSDVMDVRVTDRRKDAQIEALRGVVHTQQWSLDQCQDLALEVDSLKTEISSFLNSSNHDSGMWERDASPSPAHAAELRDIAAQLLLLRDMLTADCTCGLEKENKALKQQNTALQQNIAELEQKLAEREAQLTEKANVEQHLKEDVDLKEKELSSLREQLVAEIRSSKDQSADCECLARKLKQTEVLLDDKCAELSSVQRLYAQEQSMVQELKMELQQRAAGLSEENTRIRDEVQSLRAQVGMWRAQLADSERGARALRAQLQRARELCQRLQDEYEEAGSAPALQRQLAEAQARGARLCEDTRLALLAVRRWTRAAREVRREQEEKIKEQQETIEFLEQQLNPTENEEERRRASKNDKQLNEKPKGQSLKPCCSKGIPRPQSRKSETDVVFPRKCSFTGVKERRESTTESASGSSAPLPSLKMGTDVIPLAKYSCLSPKGRKESMTETACGSSVLRPLSLEKDIVLPRKCSHTGVKERRKSTTETSSGSAASVHPLRMDTDVVLPRKGSRTGAKERTKSTTETASGSAASVQPLRMETDVVPPRKCSRTGAKERTKSTTETASGSAASMQPLRMETDIVPVAKCSCAIAKERKESTTESASGSSAPVPPLRIARRKSSHDRLCLCKSQRDTEQTSTDSKSTSTKHKPAPQAGARRHSPARDVRYVTDISDPFRRRGLSPASELEAHVTRLQEALSRGQRRWTRHRSVSHTR